MVHVTHDTARQAFQRTFDTFGTGLNQTIRSVAIKINLCDYRRAESGATTDPVLLGSLLDVLLERFPNAQFTVFENDASSVEMGSMFRLLGIDQVARDQERNCTMLPTVIGLFDPCRAALSSRSSRSQPSWISATSSLTLPS